MEVDLRYASLRKPHIHYPEAGKSVPPSFVIRGQNYLGGSHPVNVIDADSDRSLGEVTYSDPDNPFNWELEINNMSEGEHTFLFAMRHNTYPCEWGQLIFTVDKDQKQDK